MTLPNFFVIGVPKAGTTALHVALAQHPQLYMSEVKEPKFFLCDGPPTTRGGPGDARTSREHIWRREDYEALFARAPQGALRGESTPFYLYDPDAQRRLHDAVPDARLIAILRDPIDRAHSNWTHLWSAGLEPEDDFLAACRLEQRRAEDGWAPFWRYLDLGRYGEQLRRLYTRFPREQVLVLRYRQLRDEPAATLDRICGFLGVEAGLVREIPAANVTTHASASSKNRMLSELLRALTAVDRYLPGPIGRRGGDALSRMIQSEQRRRSPLTDEQRAELIPHFAADVALLQELTGESFGDWLRAAPRTYKGEVKPVGRFGTAYQSIDRPLGEHRDRAARSQDASPPSADP
jgi:Sulfotransferase family